MSAFHIQISMSVKMESTVAVDCVSTQKGLTDADVCLVTSCLVKTTVHALVSAVQSHFGVKPQLNHNGDI